MQPNPLPCTAPLFQETSSLTSPFPLFAGISRRQVRCWLIACPSASFQFRLLTFIGAKIGFRDSALAFERDSRVERLDEYFKSHIGPGKLVYLVQRGLLYEELAAQIDRVRSSACVLSMILQLTGLCRMLGRHTKAGENIRVFTNHTSIPRRRRRGLR